MPGSEPGSLKVQAAHNSTGKEQDLCQRNPALFRRFKHIVFAEMGSKGKKNRKGEKSPEKYL
jgi:hypothetical protein